LDIKIRTETAADIPAIEAVTVSAFLNAPHTSHTEQFIVSALRKAGLLTISLVADAEGTVIGHVAVSPVSISDGHRNTSKRSRSTHPGRAEPSRTMRPSMRRNEWVNQSLECQIGGG
jgi:putative acetyltransferase